MGLQKVVDVDRLTTVMNGSEGHKLGQLFVVTDSHVDVFGHNLLSSLLLANITCKLAELSGDVF